MLNNKYFSFSIVISLAIIVMLGTFGFDPNKPINTLILTTQSIALMLYLMNTMDHQLKAYENMIMSSAVGYFIWNFVHILKVLDVLLLPSWVEAIIPVFIAIVHYFRSKNTDEESTYSQM